MSYFSGFRDRDNMRDQFFPQTEWNKVETPVPEDFPTDEQILFAAYEGAPYEGAAFVLFRGQDGKLYEVNGSHCSCYGLEDQWSPEETSVEAIELRPDLGLRSYEYADEIRDAFRKILNQLKEVSGGG